MDNEVYIDIKTETLPQSKKKIFKNKFMGLLRNITELVTEYGVPFLKIFVGIIILLILIGVILLSILGHYIGIY